MAIDTDTTFENYDTLNRKRFAERLTRVINGSCPFYDEAFVLSLNGKYGSGKTAFLSMWKNELESQDPPYKVVYLNAWETDFDEEPLIPIISTFIESLEIGGKATDKLKNLLKGMLGTVAIIGNEAISKTTSIDVKDNAKKVKAQFSKKDMQSIGEDLYKTYSYKLEVYNELKAELEQYVSKLDKPLMIFIDELDRVRPNYAVEFLEAIKHIFSVQGLCFVIAVDRDQIESSVQRLYGNIDFKNYYLRFVTREASLPEAYDGDYTDFIEYHAESFIKMQQDAGINFAFKTENFNNLKDFQASIAKIFRLKPRQVKNVFRTFSQIMAVSEENKHANPAFIFSTILLLAIRTTNETMFNDLGNDNAKPKDVYEYLKTLNYGSIYGYGKHLEDIIYEVFCASANESTKLEYARILSERTNPNMKAEEKEENIKQQLQFMTRYLGSYRSFGEASNFSSVYKIIEEWKEFFER